MLKAVGKNAVPREAIWGNELIGMLGKKVAKVLRALPGKGPKKKKNYGNERLSRINRIPSSQINLVPHSMNYPS